MKIKLSKLISWLYPIQLKKAKGELGHTLEVNVSNGKVVLDTSHVNYSYGALQEVFDYAFTRSDLYDMEIRSALILGFGSGSVSLLLHTKCDPEIEVTGVEFDQEVIRLAKEYFPEARSKKVNIVHGTAEHFVENSEDIYDLVVIDVFLEDKVPVSVQAIPFLQHVKSLLSKNGKVYFNKMKIARDAIDTYQLEKNLRAVFRTVKTIPVNRGGVENVVFVGGL